MTNYGEAQASCMPIGPLKADVSFFHVFNSMIKSGEVKRLGPHATTVYIVVKSYANFATGEAFPSVETISQKSSISARLVITSLNKLVEYGYLKKERRGRSNIYQLREKIVILDKKGTPTAIATWDYIPLMVEETRVHLRRLLLEGQLASGNGLILIEQLNVQMNVQIVTGGQAIQINVHPEGQRAPK